MNFYERCIQDHYIRFAYFFDASRQGSAAVRAKYNANIVIQVVILLATFGIWWLLKRWIFPDFNPLSYWNLNGEIWPAIFCVSLPAIFYAVVLGQLDWFSDDSDEEGTIVSENLGFKAMVSFFAGLLEELGHRGVYIFFGLIAIWWANLTFFWILAIFLLVVFVLIAAATEGWKIDIVIGAAFVGFFVWLFRHTDKNFILLIQGWTLSVYQWIAAEHWRIILIFLPLMLLFLQIQLAGASAISRRLFGKFLRNKERAFRKQRNIGPAEMVFRVVSFVCWTCYALPKGVSALSAIPFVPAHASRWIALLYLGAILWSNAKFRDGHKYQGAAGMLNSYIFGFYMFYLAFNYGLAYAIVVHFAFDLFLFSSEHMVQVIKNRSLVC
ncbi:MAG: hypothetical protein ABIH38_04885 [Patescibacteria group bacterium]